MRWRANGHAIVPSRCGHRATCNSRSHAARRATLRAPHPPHPAPPLKAFLVSTGLVALAEIGDKTQLLSLMLAARLRRPVPIILGILVATLANHALAGATGQWIATLLGAETLRWIVGLSFIAMAGWILVPDKLDADDTPKSHGGAFVTTVVAFFIAEMGDKTQIATVALAARFDALAMVVAGTTLGMLIANVPAVLLGDRLAGKLPVRLVHGIAAAIFAALGLFALFGPR
jgi:putative Ca2+/H+ antiporter (TMEM165/GDT1 family)